VLTVNFAGGLAVTMGLHPATEFARDAMAGHKLPIGLIPASGFGGHPALGPKRVHTVVNAARTSPEGAPCSTICVMNDAARRHGMFRVYYGGGRKCSDDCGRFNRSSAATSQVNLVLRDSKNWIDDEPYSRALLPAWRRRPRPQAAGAVAGRLFVYALS
jgi:hypothetical protein